MYFVRKPDRKGRPRYVFIYGYVNGRPAPLPRSQTKHLDGQPDHNIRFFIAEWEARNGKPRESAGTELTHPGLRKQVDRYLKYLENRRKDSKTIETHRRGLLFHALPCLLDLDPSCTDPNQWPMQASKLLQAMTIKNITDNNIRLANVALRGFWQWLQEENEVLNKGVQLLLRNPVGSRKGTPLKRTVSPEEVLTFARMAIKDAQAAKPGTQEHTRFRRAGLMALVGYFFSLRPQELFALERRQFKAGSKAAGLQCVKNMRGAGLGGLLAYNVQRQRDEDGDETPPKQDSRGWVACFNDDAARLVVELLKEFPQEGYILPINADSLYGFWSRNGISGVTLKDLRRASILWLGHNSKLTPTQLQKHARHLDFESTEWYLRDPDAEDSGELEDLDLDA